MLYKPALFLLVHCCSKITFMILTQTLIPEMMIQEIIKFASSSLKKLFKVVLCQYNHKNATNVKKLLPKMQKINLHVL